MLMMIKKLLHRPLTMTHLHRLNIVAATALEIGLALGHTEVGLDKMLDHVLNIMRDQFNILTLTTSLCAGTSIPGTAHSHGTEGSRGFEFRARHL